MRKALAGMTLILAFSFTCFAAPQPKSAPSESATTSLPFPSLSALNLGLQMHNTELDCSHFVHFLFAMTGKTYDYLPSREMFKGAPGFKRIRRPQAGDLIVWRGHVGIIVNPQQHTFLSKLNSGIKVARYDTDYWRRRGAFRFLRYAGATSEAQWQTAQAD